MVASEDALIALPSGQSSRSLSPTGDHGPPADEKSASTIDPHHTGSIDQSSDSIRSTALPTSLTDKPDTCSIEETAESEKRASFPLSQDDLSESKLFDHGEAESMYMSAMSSRTSSSGLAPGVPGGWESSGSSQAGSDISAPIPASMLAGSILEPLPEAEDGGETPRPGSPQSVYSPEIGRAHV